MAGEILDNKGRGDASWNWPAIHPEGRKFGLIAVAVSLFFLLFLFAFIVLTLCFSFPISDIHRHHPS